MDENKDDREDDKKDERKNNSATKMANHAWRKRPRKFAPKSRLGCKTCKVRRVKCDLAEPACKKCTSTGRTCDGYPEDPYAPKSKSPEESGSSGGLGVYSLKKWNTRPGSILLANSGPGPLMVLPSTAVGQADAIGFFEYVSVKHLNQYNPSEPWKDALMFFSQTVPSVRYAAVALGVMHRNYMSRDSGSWLPDKAPLQYYNQAIQNLLSHKTSDNIETTAVTLLVCYLFICFDQLSGDYVQAFKHLRGGLDLLHSFDKDWLDSNCGPCANTTSKARLLLYEVVKRIRRLDLQAVMFVTDWVPSDIQGTMSQLTPFSGAFRSFESAADELYALMAGGMSIRNMEQQIVLSGKTPPPHPPLKNLILGHMEVWSSLFESLVQQDNNHNPRSGFQSLISLLRLQFLVARTYLRSYGPGREMEYDSFLPEFQQCVVLARDVAVTHKATLTPEIGIIPLLYLVGVKCRHSGVRREALDILRRHPIREAVWDTMFTAKVVERVIEIEEAGMVAPTMEQIPIWQRVEAVVWEHVVSGPSAPRLNTTYTFCTREGLHTETLII